MLSRTLVQATFALSLCRASMTAFKSRAPDSLSARSFSASASENGSAPF